MYRYSQPNYFVMDFLSFSLHRMDSRIGKKQRLSSENFQYLHAIRCILEVRRENTVEICSIIKNNVRSDIYRRMKIT